MPKVNLLPDSDCPITIYPVANGLYQVRIGTNERTTVEMLESSLLAYLELIHKRVPGDIGSVVRNNGFCAGEKVIDRFVVLQGLSGYAAATEKTKSVIVLEYNKKGGN